MCVCVRERERERDTFFPFGESGRDHFFCCCQCRNNLVMAVLCQYNICALFDNNNKVRIKTSLPLIWGSQVAQWWRKESAFPGRRHKRCRCNPWVGKIPWSGHGNPLQYSCLKNSMNRGAYWVTVHGVPKSQRWLNTHTHTHTYIHIPHLYKILVIRFCSKCLSGEHILYQVFSDTFWLVISNLT